MKKFISLLALVSVFAACQKEDINTAFKVDPGVATIHVTATSIDGKDITANTSFTFDGVEGSKDYVVPNTSSTAALEKTVKVKASWKGWDGNKDFSEEKDVKVYVLPGGNTDIDVNFILGKLVIDEFTYKIKTVEGQFKVEYFFLDKAHDAGHEGVAVDHTGASEEQFNGYFVHNLSEFILRGTVEYTEKKGSYFADENKPFEWIKDIKEVKDYFENAVNEQVGVEENAKTFDITISAFAQYCVFHKLVSQEITYEFHRYDSIGNDEIVAKSATWKYKENQEGFFESAVPGHEGHYVAGHGHDDPAHSHGHGSDNAGGGIVYAD